MLTKAEFESLLDCYFAGKLPPNQSRHVLEQWQRQLDQDEPPALSAAELEESRRTTWARIQELTASRIPPASSQPADVDINEIIFRPTRQEL
ncbi:hypothetical protein [Hymenobacter polaris]|uniref:hypothetical protein n=1 Tax=Hymenobacter polaris TaxID=2682546 RepID=UPI0018A2BE70|nr:hypothetical protein [Hymenobacter polaris]